MRNNRNDLGRKNPKQMLYISGAVLGLAIITFVIVFISYSNRLNNKTNMAKLNTEKISDLVPSSKDDAESASTSIGKTVEESKSELDNTEEDETDSNEIIDQNTNENTNTNNANVNNNTNTSEAENTKTQEPKKTQEIVSFIMPVEGDIIKEFAKDKLIFSETLKEWTTHLGIDIRSEKTAIVKASADGTVKAIKNDPRYGVTVILEHKNGYTSVYSNLLTAEFVVESEELKQGQTLGTVGNTAVFEISDDYHLHFEILRDGEYIDPTILLK